MESDKPKVPEPDPQVVEVPVKEIRPRDLHQASRRYDFALGQLGCGPLDGECLDHRRPFGLGGCLDDRGEED